MPCTITGSLAGDAALDAAEARAEATRLNAMLCRVCEQAESDRRLTHLPKDVRYWWINHKRMDQIRRDSELNAKIAHVNQLRKELERAEAELEADDGQR